MLVSRGVPSDQPLLSCNWVRDKAEPHVNNAPHYVSSGGYPHALAPPNVCPLNITAIDFGRRVSERVYRGGDDRGERFTDLWLSLRPQFATPLSREQMAPRRTSAGSPIRRDSVSLRRVRSRRPLGRSPV